MGTRGQGYQSKMTTEDRNIISVTIARLFQELGAANEQPTVSRELLSSLHSIFGPTLLLAALDLVDRGNVTVLVGENSDRQVVVVQGGSVGLKYTLLRGAHLCS